MRIALISLCWLSLVLLPSTSYALDRCKAAVDKGSGGVITVSAAQLDPAGTLLWGDVAGNETNVFDNQATCIAATGTKASKCELGAPGTPEQITPPARCTIYLDDGLSTPCSATLAGCTPSRLLPGKVEAFAGDASSVPVGWLLTDGSAVSRAVFADLFAVIGSTHGEGDGATTFNVPDYRGRFLRGVDGAAGRDPNSGGRSAMNAGGNSGNAVGSVQGGATTRPTANFTTVSSGSHSHGMLSAGSHNHSVGFGGTHSHNAGDLVVRSPNEDGDANGSPRWAAQRFNVFTASAGSHSHSVSFTGSHAHTISASGSHSHTQGIGDAETRPINAYVNWIVKY